MITDAVSRYDPECTAVRIDTHAQGVVLMILGGYKGSGFTIQMVDPSFLPSIAQALRAAADDIERHIGAGMNQ